MLSLREGVLEVSINTKNAIAAAVMGAAIRLLYPDTTAFDVLSVAALSAAISYIWCRFVDYIFARQRVEKGKNLK